MPRHGKPLKCMIFPLRQFLDHPMEGAEQVKNPRICDDLHCVYKYQTKCLEKELNKSMSLREIHRIEFQYECHLTGRWLILWLILFKQVGRRKRCHDSSPTLIPEGSCSSQQRSVFKASSLGFLIQGNPRILWMRLFVCKKLVFFLRTSRVLACST